MAPQAIALTSADEYISVITSAGASEDSTRPEAEVIHARVIQEELLILDRAH